MLRDLSDAEQAVVSSFQLGTHLLIEDDIRAHVIAWLLLGGVVPEAGQRARLCLEGARIRGTLDLTSSVVQAEVSLTRCVFTEPVILSRGTFSGFQLTQCLLDVFSAAEATFATSLSLSGCTVDQITLTAARITGDLLLCGSTITRTHLAVRAEKLTCSGDVLLSKGFAAHGRVDLTGASAGGRFILDEAEVADALWEPAVAADGVVARGFSARKLVAQGICLVGAEINGRVDFTDAQLQTRKVPALNAEAIAAVSFWCRRDFTATGKIHLYAAQISGQLDLTATILGPVELCRATVGQLRPPAQALSKLDGLAYQELDPFLPAGKRLELLARDPDHFRPGPYEQLASYYQRLGLDDDARLVQLAKRRAHRQQFKPLRRFADTCADLLAGYGYQPNRAALWFLLALVAGAAYFGLVAKAVDPWLLSLDLILPTNPLGVAGGQIFSATAAWVAAVLRITGWALSLALLPMALRALGRT